MNCPGATMDRACWHAQHIVCSLTKLCKTTIEYVHEYAGHSASFIRGSNCVNVVLSWCLCSVSFLTYQSNCTFLPFQVKLVFCTVMVRMCLYAFKVSLVPLTYLFQSTIVEVLIRHLQLQAVLYRHFLPLKYMHVNTSFCLCLYTTVSN